MGEAFHSLGLKVDALVPRSVRSLARLVGRSVVALVRDDRGSPMLEAIVGISIFAVVGAAVLGGISTTRRAGASLEQQAIAENIARNHMESLFSVAYREPTVAYATSTSAVALPRGYGVNVVTENLTSQDTGGVAVTSGTDVEKVIVTVTFEGRTVLVLESARARP